MAPASIASWSAASHPCHVHIITFSSVQLGSVAMFFAGGVCMLVCMVLALPYPCSQVSLMQACWSPSNSFSVLCLCKIVWCVGLGAHTGEKKNEYMILVRKREGRKPLGRPRC